jgi:hypothetical protein
MEFCQGNWASILKRDPVDDLSWLKFRPLHSRPLSRFPHCQTRKFIPTFCSNLEFPPLKEKQPEREKDGPGAMVRAKGFFDFWNSSLRFENGLIFDLKGHYHKKKNTYSARFLPEIFTPFSNIAGKNG